jgi:hypothetical protein
MPTPINKLRIGALFRYSDKATSPEEQFVDGLPNYYAATHTPGATKAVLVKGINPLQSVKLPGKQERMPAIILVSSPRKAGTVDTPWENYLDVDNGYVRYFGDNAKPDQNPDDANGNFRLREQFMLHASEDRSERLKASPIIIFERSGAGYLSFQGVGIVTNVELVMQRVPGEKTAFANYVFEFVVLNLAETQDTFDWNWISKRRDASISDEDSLSLAPLGWKTWVSKGNGCLPSVRRRVAQVSVVDKEDQFPAESSQEYKDLKQIYDYYTDKKNKHGFEPLAAKVAERLFQSDGRGYTHGWITKASGDGGADFVGRLDVGDGFSKLRIVVLGQAKCEQINKPTGGNHIARLVARLRRGWVGVYVTTSYFSDNSQQEVIEDRCPIMLVNGKKVAQEVRKMARESGREIKEFLEMVDEDYQKESGALDVRRLDPEQVLFKA